MTTVPQYLLALYRLEQREGGPVATGRLATMLERSPAATTEMIQRLEADGYVSYEPYEGVTLTPEGAAEAESLYETYQILSQFFREVLHLDAYEKEAMQLAGTVSPTVADRLASTILTDERDEAETNVLSTSSNTESD